MQEMPLFPLNSVLFPWLPLHLHIFEERYKQMIEYCLAHNPSFGVVLIKRGMEALGPLAEPYSIGCTARIHNIQKLDQGKMNIIIIGEERFKILDIDQVSHPYLLGIITPFPLRSVFSEVEEDLYSQLRDLSRQYIQILEKAGGMQIDSQNLPDDPIQLSYLMADLLQIPQIEKQNLLSLEYAYDFNNSLKGIYRREIALLNSLHVKQGPSSQSVFSLN